jgi:hypothetical protein
LLIKGDRNGAALKICRTDPTKGASNKIGKTINPFNFILLGHARVRGKVDLTHDAPGLATSKF